MSNLRRGFSLITGASSGIGYELAKVFSRKKHDLVIIARNRVKLYKLATELMEKDGIDVRVISKDLSTETSAQEIVDELRRDSIRVEILVNNAGFDVYGNFYETDWSDELNMIHTHLLTLTHLTKLLLNEMRNQGYGRILNVGSTGSFIPTPLNAVYSATKAYVHSFTVAIAEELRGSGVTVTTLCPGATLTEFQRRAGMDDFPLLPIGAMEAGKVAEIGYRAMMLEKWVAIPGMFNKIQVLFSRLHPGSVMARMAKAMLQIR